MTNTAKNYSEAGIVEQIEVFKELEKFNVYICVLTESIKRWKRSGEMEYYIHLESEHSTAKVGISAVIRKTLKKSIKSWKTVNKQILKWKWLKIDTLL